MVLEIWLIEFAKGVGTLFIHPLLYWFLLLLMFTGIRRIKKEREYFGAKINNLFAEGKQTLVIALLFSIIVSALAISFGIIISFETIILLGVVMIILSMTTSTTMLSASYTLGITFIILLLISFIDLHRFEAFMQFQDLSAVHFICLAILTGLFLLVEALLLGTTKKGRTFSTLSLSERGIWTGQHQLKRLAFVPFFALLPTDSLTGITPLYPYFEYGNQTFSLVLLPFFLGYQYNVRSELPEKAAEKLGRATLLLGFLVLLCAIGSLFFPVFSLVAIILSIVGKEWITYRHRLQDRRKPAFFRPLDEGIKVLDTIPNSPADRLEILTGEIILKVNGTIVTDSTQLYKALQNSGAFFKLDVLDYNGEVRFIHSAFYEEDHHELGIIFAEKPFNHVEENDKKVN